MELIASATLDEALAAWALHEYRGRHYPHLPAHLKVESAEEARYIALQLLLRSRWAVLAPILAAGIREVWRVRLTADALSALYVMGHDPVERWSRNKRAEAAGGDGSADYVRALIASPEPVGGPFVTVGRAFGGPLFSGLTFFDGMHRVAAWVAHVTAGRRYPLEDVYVICTARPCPAWELPAAPEGPERKS